MNFLKKLFGRQQSHTSRIKTIPEFWNWFVAHQSKFHQVVNEHRDVEEKFINPVFDKLNEIQSGAFLLTGMMDEKTAELIITAEGSLLSFPYVEDIVAQAPQLEHWQFTAFKPSMDRPSFSITMDEKDFSTDNVFFYPDIDEQYPDEISIQMVYKDPYNEAEQKLIGSGCYVFLENYLGEIKMSTELDYIDIDHKVDPSVELVPISKLVNYINYRQKEFTERYEATIHDSENANYATFEGTRNDLPLIGMVNEDLLNWDKKASHPYVMIVSIKYDKEVNNGLPNRALLDQFHEFEEKIRTVLPDHEGYLHVAQTTGEGVRDIFLANKSYTKPITTLQQLKNEVSFEFEIDIFKDKYWRCMNHLMKR